jgi:hypothetical protein
MDSGDRLSLQSLPRPAPRVFLSYAREDRVWVQKFKEWFLPPLGTVVIIDFEDGQNLEFGPLGPWLDLRDEMTVMVAFLSRHYPERVWTPGGWHDGLTKTLLGQLIFVPVMMDADAKVWWAVLRKRGDLPLPADYQFADFVVEGKTAVIGDNGPIIDQISRLGQKVREFLNHELNHEIDRIGPPRTDPSQGPDPPDLSGKEFVFVSYAREDRETALNIVNDLESRGVPCWIAPRNVRPGFPYDDEIAKAIEECKLLLLLFSNNCNESAYIRRELTVAGESRKHIIPYRIEDVQPKKGLRIRLSDLHWIDAFSSPGAIEEVVKICL